MKILHIAPHYGGGIAPAVVGIVEATTASHTLLGIDSTNDSVSVNLLNLNRLTINSPLQLFGNTRNTQEWDFIIFHFWDSSLWQKLTQKNFRCYSKAIVLLNHQSFAHNGNQVSLLDELFDACLQSGFIGNGCPANWTLIPTCKTQEWRKEVPNRNMNGSIYMGTLDYKKISEDFFLLARKLPEQALPLKVYGKLHSKTFATDLNLNQNEKLQYCGYAMNKASIFDNANFFFYPLRPGHYGTSESSLLEAMSAGLLPLVKNNPAEAAILGDELLPFLNIDNILSNSNSTIFNNHNIRQELSAKIKDRSFKLTNNQLRKKEWEEVFEKNKGNSRIINVSDIAHGIVGSISQNPNSAKVDKRKEQSE